MIIDADLDFAPFAPALTAGDHAEAYLESSRGTAIQFEDSRVTEINAGSDRGVGLRYLVPAGGAIETIYGSINDFDAAAARAMADRLLCGVERRPAPRETARVVRLHRVFRDPLEVPMARKVELLRSIDKVVRGEFPHIAQVGLSYAERIKHFAVLDGRGRVSVGDRVSVVLVISVTAEKNGVLQNGMEVIGGLKGYEILGDFDPLRAARRAARNAVAQLDAPVAQAGEMPVVLAASAGGTFVHEAIGHSLEADHVQEGSSPHYVGKIGQPVAREFLTIVDDPTLPFYRGSFPFDDEGVAAKPTPVVQNGVLADYLYDRLSAMRDKRKSNGHGRRESFKHRPIPRMSNLYIAPGPDDPRKILAELDRGLLVTQMGGGEVNTATGEFVFGVDEGYWVEDGQIKHRVRDANMLGVGPEVLQSIDRLGWDIGWGIGTCGKEGQGVPVADGQPTLRIPKLTIGGRS